MKYIYNGLLLLISLASIVTVIFCVSTIIGKGRGTIKTETTIVNTPVVDAAVQQTQPMTVKKEIVNLRIPLEQVVPLVGEINEDAIVVAGQVTKAATNGSKLPVFLLISSPGGNVMYGANVINAIEASPVPVYTVCMDLCASMGAIIHQYGTQRLMVDRSILMFHDAAGGFNGYFPHVNSRYTTMARYIARFNTFIAARTNMKLDDLVQAEHTELWLDAEDSVTQNFTDHLVYIQVYNKIDNQTVNLMSLLRPAPQKSPENNKPEQPVTPKFFELTW